MNRCTACGAELPPSARFCSNCGKVQNTLSSGQYTRPSEPRLQAVFPAGADPMATLIQDKARSASTTPPHHSLRPGEQTRNMPSPPAPEGKQELGKAVLLDSVSLMPGNQPQVPHIPTLQGTPQVHSVPTIQGPLQGGGQPPAAPLPGGSLPNISPPGASGQIATPSGYPPQFGPAQPPSYPGHPPYTQYNPYTGLESHGTQTGQFGQMAGHGAHVGKAAAAKAAGGMATRLIIIIAAAIVAVGGGAGALAYVITRPQPVIHVSSQYLIGKTPVGSAGTRLHFTGQQFSGNSTITFLLDNESAPGAPHAISDQNGNVSADLPITSSWPQGLHTLTARDASNNTSKTGVAIRIVPQGQAHTPGPSGAPPDDTSFKISAQERGQYTGSGSFTDTELLIVTGHPDPAGGSVCKDKDTGQPKHTSGLKTSNGTPYSEDITLTCQGSYKGGNLTYTETMTANVVTLDTDGGKITCHLSEPKVLDQWSGSYTATGSFSGTITYPGISRDFFSCTTGNYDFFYFYYYSGSATWTGAYIHA